MTTKMINVEGLLVSVFILQAIYCSVLAKNVATQVDQEEVVDGFKLSAAVKLLSDKEWQHGRVRAMRAITAYAKSPEKYLSAYLDALSDPDPTIRGTAAECLATLGKRVPSLTDEFLHQMAANLNDHEPLVRQHTLYALGKLGHDALSELKSIRQVYENDQSPQVREAALGVMIETTRDSPEHLSHLLMAVNQNEFRVYGTWIEELGDYAADSPEVIISLRKILLRQQDLSRRPGERTQAAISLARAETQASPAIEDLFSALSEPITYPVINAKLKERLGEKGTAYVQRTPLNFRLRLMVSWAITRIDPNSTNRLFELLGKQLTDANSDMRLSAALIVGRLAYMDAARQLEGPIEQLSSDKVPLVRSMARLSRLLLDDPGPVPADYPLRHQPAPRDNRILPDSPAMRETLRAKMKRIATVSDRGDYETIMWELFHPCEIARALLHDRFHSEAQSEGSHLGEYYKNEFAVATDEQIIIDGREAKLLATDGKYVMRFTWFDGEWYLVD